MTKEEADKYWELFYQGKKDAFDYANILIKREEYNNANSKFGWTIDYKDIKKIALNKNEQLSNTFPCSIIAKNIRQDKQHFHINGKEFNFLMDNETKTKKLYEIRGKEKRCVDPHQRLEARLNDTSNEKVMEIRGVKIKARQEINGDLVLLTTDEEQLLTGLFSLADYIDKFKSKIKDNKNILVEIPAKLAKTYEIPSSIFISTEKNKSEDLLLLRELILNKNNTTFDYNEEEKTLYCYDENQTHKSEFIKKQLMLEDEIYYLTIKIKDHDGFLSLFYSEEYDDNSEDSAPEIDAAFTFNLNKHDITEELKKEELLKEEKEQNEELEEKDKEELVEEESEEPEQEEIIESKFSHRFDTLLNINKEEIKKDLEKLNLERTKKEMKELEEKVAREKAEQEKKRQKEEESQKLKDFIGQEDYKTQTFKKEKLKLNNETKDRTKTLVDEVAVSIAKEIKEKIEEKEKEEIRINENAEAPKEEVQQEVIKEKEISKKDIDPTTIKITAEFAKNAIENQEAITEKLGELDESEFEGIEPKEIEEENIEPEQEEVIEEEETLEQEEVIEEEEEETPEVEETTEEETTEEETPLEEQEGQIKEEELKKEKEETNKKEEIIAKQLFRKIYGEQVIYGKDFAGRTIKFDDFAKEDSDTGWNYILLTDTFGIELENIVLANIQSLKDFDMNKKFVSNNQEFYVTKKGEKYLLQSDEVLTNPFSYYDAKRLAYINRKKMKKLCYIYIKCTEIDGLNVKIENFNVFVDFVQRSIHKIVGSTLINFEVGRDFIFITFDADKEEAYKEAYYYSVLLNSYRKELKKDKIINAVLVLSSIEVPISFLNKSSRDFIFDPEFKSIYDSLNQKQIDVTIKRAIHISPDVLNRINLDRNQLKKSRILQNLDLEEYYECNNVYLLNREEN